MLQLWVRIGCAGEVAKQKMHYIAVRCGRALEGTKEQLLELWYSGFLHTAQPLPKPSINPGLGDSMTYVGTNQCYISLHTYSRDNLAGASIHVHNYTIIRSDSKHD